ncbi:RING-type E3 ubiquitin transferase [Sarracenia purpurea var. burkii]
MEDTAKSTCAGCPICRDNLVVAPPGDVWGDMVQVTPCGHVAHAACLQAWFLYPLQNSCPKCRRPMTRFDCQNVFMDVVTECVRAPVDQRTAHLHTRIELAQARARIAELEKKVERKSNKIRNLKRKRDRNDDVIDDLVGTISKAVDAMIKTIDDGKKRKHTGDFVYVDSDASTISNDDTN